MADQTTIPVTMEVCRRCHQPNLVPTDLPDRAEVLCRRCDGPLRSWSHSLHNNRLSAVFAAAALIFFIPAVTLPLMGIQRFGFVNEVGLIDGVISLMQHDNFFLGLIVLACSVFLPIGKILGLLVLSTRGPRFSAHHQAFIFQLIEWTGRFSVLDVLLVAVLIAAIKVGDLVSVHPGAGLAAFATVVFLSLLSSWAFDPDEIWRPPHGQSDQGQ